MLPNERKDEYIRACLRKQACTDITKENPYFLAAAEVFPHDYSLQVFAATVYAASQEFANRRMEIIAEQGREAFLPGTAELAGIIWQRIQEGPSSDQLVALGKLYAELKGLDARSRALAKSTSPKGAAGQSGAKVLIVQSFEGDNWEDALAAQQAALSKEE